ncbi:MAG: hypothetical protein ACE15E_03050 [Acidobacteriota bacterium]
MLKNLNLVDWLTIGVYAVLLVSIALYHSRKMNRQDDFFLAGRTMSRWPIALSMFMALFSTNSLIGTVGWVNRPHGTVWILLGTLGLMAAVPASIWLFPAVFFKLRVRTAYEYLEARFNYPVRALAALLFLGARAMWMATMLYAASLLISMMLGWTPEQGIANGEIWTIVILGGLALMLAFAGGMRAVIWTDCFQFFVMMTGVIAIVVVGISYSGGPAEIYRAALAAGKLELPRFFSVTDDISFITLFLFGFSSLLFSTGADQVYLQTYLTAKSEAESKASILRDGLLLKPLAVIFPMLGLILFAYYRVHPFEASLMRVPDDALPVFILHVLPAGIRGMMVAAFTSALLTSLEGGMAAMSATVQIDFVGRWRKSPLGNADAVRLGRLLVLIWGLLVILGAVWIRALGAENNVLQILNIVMYPFSGVLLGIFLLGLLFSRASGPGVLAGGMAGFVTVLLFALGPKLVGALHGMAVSPSWLAGLLQNLGAVSTFYYCVIGAVATVVFGLGASCCLATPPGEKTAGLTRWSLHERGGSETDEYRDPDRLAVKDQLA